MMVDDSEGVQNGDNHADVEIAEDSKDKRVYIKLKLCLDDEKDLNITDGVVQSVTLSSDMTCKKIRQLLLSEFNLQDSTLVLKLRNQYESIIPLSYSMSENSDCRPYLLEVCNRYQNVTPFERTVSVPTYEQVLKRKVQTINKRLTKLEHYAPELPDKQLLKIDEEIRDLNEKMNVLDRKLKDADETQWQGMFKKNPLW